MNFHFKVFLIFFIFIHFTLFCDDEILWEEIENGCFYSRVNIYKNNEITDTVNIIKILPDKFYFRVFYREKEKGWPEMYDIKEWHDRNPEAKIFINGSYYDENRKPTTAIWRDGVCINRKKGIINKGGLLFYIKGENNRDIMDLVSLTQQPVDVIKENFYSAIQSMPILIFNGQITVKKSTRKANRTVIAKDKEGYIFIVVSEGSVNYKSFTLYDISEWLLKNNPDIVLAINMDGGDESQLSIKTDRLKYTTIEQRTTNDTSDISKQGYKIKIPLAIGFYSKDVR